MEVSPEQGLRAWVEYLRDMGVYDLYRREPAGFVLSEELRAQLQRAAPASPSQAPAPRAAVAPGPSAAPVSGPSSRVSRAPGVTPKTGVGMPHAGASRPMAPVQPAAAEPARNYFNANPEMETEAPLTLSPELAAPMPKPQPLEMLAPAPAMIAPAQRQAALDALRAEIGDCTRCPLAYAGRHTVVFGDGNPNAELMFVGEGPGADEDASGLPFVGKAGQLLNNMIGAMGLRREDVYIGNIVKCRPPGNRVPEFVEATTCSQFLLQQIDIVRPKVIVALGATAATYVLGVRQPLASLRGQWFQCRGAKVAVTYHPAFLLRDPRQKAEAWKDLQRVMVELGLTSPAAKKS